MLVLRRLASAGLTMLAVLVLAELLLRALPVQGGLGAADPVPGWPAHRSVPYTSYVSSSGWALGNVQRGRINNVGYIAPFDYHDGDKVGVVLGDSFIEGYMNPYEDMLQARLARVFERPITSVYNFGTSGASLPHYLGIAQLVGARYHAKWAVVLIGPGDFSEGFGHTHGYFSWGTPREPAYAMPEVPHGRLAKLVRDSALVRYVLGDLKFKPAALFSSGFPAPRRACAPASLTSHDRALVSGWVDRMPQALNLAPSEIALVFNADLTAMQVGGKAPSVCPSTDSQALALLAGEARSRGYQVVETQPLFAAAWARDHQPLSHAPLDLHWNAHGHEVAATAIARVLGKAATSQ